MEETIGETRILCSETSASGSSIVIEIFFVAKNNCKYKKA
jgi:hypothetical protein